MWGSLWKTLGGAAAWGAIGWIGTHVNQPWLVGLLPVLTGIIGHWLPKPNEPPAP